MIVPDIAESARRYTVRFYNQGLHINTYPNVKNLKSVPELGMYIFEWEGRNVSVSNPSGTTFIEEIPSEEVIENNRTLVLEG